MNLTINGDENLEIELGWYIYEGTTDTYLLWDQMTPTTTDAIESILATIPGITKADGYGIKTDAWKPWSEVSEAIYNAVIKVEEDLRSVITKEAIPA